jgi:hypothetical protein
VPPSKVRASQTDHRVRESLFLKPGGVILIQENNQGSAPETFRAMIDAAGLSLVAAYGGEPRVTLYTRFYYLAVMRRGDAPPAWLRGLSHR